jgi:hypothetical protein
LRVRAQREANDKQIAGLYQSVQDSLARPGYKVRYAVIDAAKLDVGQPSADDLTRFYELHQADYTKYDPATSALVTTPLVQVRDELVQRWAASRRTLLLRDVAQQITAAWSAGRRDKAIESKATSVVETGAVPFGTPIGTDPIAMTISDSLNRRVYDRRVETVPYEGGLAVVHVYQLVERVVPSFEQVRGAMVQRLMDERSAAEVEAARVTFEKDPLKYQRQKAVHYSRLWVRIPSHDRRAAHAPGSAQALPDAFRRLRLAREVPRAPHSRQACEGRFGVVAGRRPACARAAQARAWRGGLREGRRARDG